MRSASGKYLAADIAKLVEGELVGDENHEITGINDLRRAGASEISFLSSDRYLDALSTSCAGCVLIKAAHAENCAGIKIIVDDPYRAYASVSSLFDTRRPCVKGIAPSAQIDPSAVIGENASIGPHCVIGADVVIGDDAELGAGVVIGHSTQIGAGVCLFPNVVLYHDLELGDKVTIHANTTIGGDGFGFAPGKDGWKKIHQVGRVKIGSNVEIGANTSIDRGAIGDTVIEDNVIVDCQVQIGHNVVLGEGTAVVACTGIAGSTKIGKNCLIGGGVGMSGHLEIADGTVFQGGTMVTKGNKEAGVFASIPPLQELSSWRRNTVRIRQLDGLFQRVKKLEKAIELNDKK